ncbi:MAG: Pr6Pr family membrane protein, partial [Pseudomonadota bacterium]
IVYHLLLRGLRDLSVMGQIADWGLHTVGPLLLVLWWLRFSPRGALWFTDLPALLAWPALYVAYALTRGGMAGRFPYPFLDPNALGWGTVLINIAELAGATVFGALVLIGIDRFRGR